MDVKSITKGVRTSPIKLRLAADMIRGKNVNEALNIINNYNSKQARIIKKSLDSAIANAINNNKLDKDNLYIKEIRVDMGQTIKRTVPGSRGSIDKNFHRTSHITIVVSEKEIKEIKQEKVEKKSVVSKKETKNSKTTKEKKES